MHKQTYDVTTNQQTNVGGDKKSTDAHTIMRGCSNTAVQTTNLGNIFRGNESAFLKWWWCCDDEADDDLCEDEDDEILSEDRLLVAAIVLHTRKLDLRGLCKWDDMQTTTVTATTCAFVCDNGMQKIQQTIKYENANCNRCWVNYADDDDDFRRLSVTFFYFSGTPTHNNNKKSTFYFDTDWMMHFKKRNLFSVLSFIQNITNIIFVHKNRKNDGNYSSEMNFPKSIKFKEIMVCAWFTISKI